MMKRPDSLTSLAAGAAAVTVALTATAFWLSYEHLHDVAAANGLTGIRAWAWPGTVDLFIIAGELLILRAAMRGRFDWFAYLLAGVGSLGSIALNVAGVGKGAELMEYIVAAVPPSAALIAFGALMRQVHEHLVPPPVPIETVTAVAVERVPEVYPALEAAVPAVPEAVPAGVRLLPIVARPEVRQPVGSFAAEQPRTRTEVHADYVPDPVPEDDKDPLTAAGFGLAAEQFKGQLFDGNVPSIRDIKGRLNVGQDRAKEIQEAFRAALPVLARDGVTA
ncbi:DUF2637 domain-containing protein [Streptomyces sp. NBC_00885]|uniref:DUF2637 domain-containing protein n=1 Tax=Streptomyces sp. NBC_00885 TaxID=2975857 RepID=UPI003870BA15|nr:DUF2637 domain-containing protein [Streptomyces sp. NBC_00885]